MTTDRGKAERRGDGGAGRALGRLAGAIFTRSGARWATPRARPVRGLLLGAALLGLGAAAAYAATEAGGAGAPAGDRAAIEAVVRDYILEHPEIITQAMQRLETRRVAALVDANRAELETPRAGAWEGAAKPDVTLVAFMDYACGYCRASLPDIARLLKEDPGLRIVYRELPVITEGSAAAARVSLYAAETGKFAAFHKAMYAQNGVDTDKILAASRAAGLDTDRVKAELANKGRDAALREDVGLAQTLEAQGTPLFVIGDQVLYGAVGYEALKDAVDKARNHG